MRLRLQFVTNLIVAFVEFLLVALLSLAFCSNFRYCVFAKMKMEELSMTKQFPVKQCQYCGGTDIGIGWQHGEALVTFKKYGVFGNRLQYLICRRCGAVLYQCVAEPHKFPRVQ